MFKDFLFFLMDNETEVPLTFIEVKRFQEMTRIDIESDAAAQTLREAHNLLCESEYSQSLEEITFVLTNSLVWSFATATKCGNKIEVTRSHVHHVTEFQTDEQLVYCLHKLMMGSGVAHVPDTSSTETET